MFLAWGVTGAGHFLFESFNLMRRLAKRKDVKVTTYLTRGGEEVVKIYGLWKFVNKISDGSYYSEIFTEKAEGASSPSAGRLAKGVYRGLIVSPASANTVAKIRFGIADTLISNAVAQALKSGTPVLILPTDQRLGEFETRLPRRLDREVCKGCLPCPSERACLTGALRRVGGKMWIDLSLCIGCDRCEVACLFKAVRFGDRIRVKPRSVDVENVEALRQMDGMKVMGSPKELRKAVEGLL